MVNTRRLSSRLKKPQSGQRPPKWTRQREQRRRTRVACGECRRRKIKCGGGEPCVPCAGYRRPCVYECRRPSPKEPCTLRDAKAEHTPEATVEAARSSANFADRLVSASLHAFDDPTIIGSVDETCQGMVACSDPGPPHRPALADDSPMDCAALPWDNLFEGAQAERDRSGPVPEIRALDEALSPCSMRLADRMNDMGGLSAACPDDIQVHFGDSPGLDNCRDGVLDWQGPPAEEMMTTHIVDSNLVLPSFDSQWTWDTFIPHVLPETRHTSFRDEGAFFDHWQPSSCNMHLESQQATAPLTSPIWTQVSGGPCPLEYDQDWWASLCAPQGTISMGDLTSRERPSPLVGPPAHDSFGLYNTYLAGSMSASALSEVLRGGGWTDGGCDT